MPKYRARIEYHDTQGREQCDVVEFESDSNHATDLAAAAQKAWSGFDQGDDKRVPHNIVWERLDQA